MKKIFLLFIHVMAFGMYSAQPPAGYYNAANGLSGAQLKTALSQIITNGHTNLTYNGLWTAYATTDRDYFYENDGSILDIYSEKPNTTEYSYVYQAGQCGNVGPEGTCYNREHIIPQSLFSSNAPMVSDIHFIRPTDSYVNGMRADYPFGVVGTASNTSTNGSKVGNSISPGYFGTVFEPIDAFKGDVARMVFYFVTRYENSLSGFDPGNMLGGSAYPGLQNWELQQLLIWNAIDPVSPMETARNNASYTYQGNRNPFIDNANYATQIWGTADSTPPTAPTNLSTSNPTTNSINLSWTASTDNVGVVAYNVYVNGTFHSTVTTNPCTISGLSANTTYTFYIIAKDLAGNSSPPSNTAQGTTSTLPSGGSCGTENFSDIPTTNPGTYTARTWTTNGITWNATDARTDQTIVTGNPAITIRNGTLTSSPISGGISSFTITTQRKFSGGSGTFSLRVNGNIVGTIPYDANVNTTTISNINTSGDVTISLTDNSVAGERVAFDDLSWTCAGSLGTQEIVTDKEIQIYPNPVKNGIIYFSGENLKNIEMATIFDHSGRILQVVKNPFKSRNYILLKSNTKGLFIIKLDQQTFPIIVE